MAEIDVTRGRRDEVVVERTGFRMSWGAIFAGFVIATALQMVLSVLGIAIGFAVIDDASARDIGIGTAIWFAATAVISLYVGGLTTGRLAGILTRGDGMQHGVVVWGLSTLLAVYFATMGMGRLVGGAFDLVARTTAATAGGVVNAAGSVGGAAISQAGGIDFDRMQMEVERALQETGNPALQPDTLQAQAGAVGATATAGTDNQALAREITERARQTAGEVRREDIVNVIAARSDMSPEEAERVATRVESGMQNARTQVSSAAASVQETAGEVAEDAAGAASRAAWMALLVMGLSLAAAVAGAGQKAPE